MVALGYFTIVFCALCAGGMGTISALVTADKIGLKKDINEIKARRAEDEGDFDDFDDENRDMLVEMASQNRAEAGDPIQ